MNLPNLKTIYGKMVFKNEIVPTGTSTGTETSTETSTGTSTGPATVLKDPINEIFYVYKINQTYSIDTLDMSDPTNKKLAKNPTFNVLGLVVKTQNNSTFYFPLEGFISDETTDKYINGSDDVLTSIHQVYTGEYEKLLDKTEFDEKYVRPQLIVTKDGIIEGIDGIDGIERIEGMYGGGGGDKIDLFPLLTIYNSPNLVKYRQNITAQSAPAPAPESSTMDIQNETIYGKIYLQLKTLQPEKVVHITDSGEEEQDIKNL